MKKKNKSKKSTSGFTNEPMVIFMTDRPGLKEVLERKLAEKLRKLEKPSK